MKGATALLLAKINRNPKSSNMAIMGTSHHSFLSHKKENNSLIIPTLANTPTLHVLHNEIYTKELLPANVYAKDVLIRAFR
jgi:hypothetical protein